MYHISQHHHTHTHLPPSLSICIHMYIGTYMRTYRHTHTHIYIYIYTHTYTSLCSKVSGVEEYRTLSLYPLRITIEGRVLVVATKKQFALLLHQPAGKKCRSTGGSSSNRNSNSKRATPTEH